MLGAYIGHGGLYSESPANGCRRSGGIFSASSLWDSVSHATRGPSVENGLPRRFGKSRSTPGRAATQRVSACDPCQCRRPECATSAATPTARTLSPTVGERDRGLIGLVCGSTCPGHSALIHCQCREPNRQVESIFKTQETGRRSPTS